jgi:capsular polysaccharide biosynthesis protein
VELELREILQIILRRIWIVVALTLVAAVFSGINSYLFLEDIYSTSTTLIVSKQGEGGYNEVQQSDIRLYRDLVQTYSIIIKSDRVLEQVITELDLQVSLADLRKKLSVNSEGNTEIIRITVEDESPEQAKNIANSLAVVFIEEVKELLRMDNVQIIDVAKLPISPVKPKHLMNIAIAAVLGFMIGLGVIFLIEYLDNTIKTPEDVQKYLDLPILGAIPSFDK